VTGVRTSELETGCFHVGKRCGSELDKTRQRCRERSKALEGRLSQLKWNGSGAAQKGQVVQVLHQLKQAVPACEVGAIAVQDGSLLRGIRRKNC
jgi:hypothetical protein